jgi:RimJ/RimL family protein N-acetyltransferase
MSRHIHTERLLLRPTALEDFERWAQMMGDADTAKFIGGIQPRSTAWRGLMTMAGAWQLTGIAMFSVIEKSTGRWLGRIGPWQPEGWPGTEVGWALHPDAHGQGFAFEAAVASIQYAREQLGWTDIIHTIDPENHASIRLAEKLGARYRGPGHLPEPFAHVAVGIWGQVAR